ncbi:MAG: arylsulfotransferase family protein [Thermomicrobiales bacterium]
MERDAGHRSDVEQPEFRSSRRGLIGGVGLGALAIAGGQPISGFAQSRRLQSSATDEVTVFPRHGTRTASPGSEITFRGATAETLGLVEVVGSRSGSHSGLLMPHSDGEGVSYVPDATFLPGEWVTVRADTPLRPTPSGSVTFKVAVPGTPVRKQTSREIDQPEHPPQHFHSRLDLLPPAMTITTPANGTAPGHTFIAAKVPDGQNGAMILDDAGDLLWYSPLESTLAEHNDFRAQEYRGEPVLTMWEGVSEVGTGFGHFVLLNGSYEAVARLQVGNGYHGADLHECVLTPTGTALFIVYNPIRWEMTAAGTAVEGTALDGVIQELDIETGRVIWEWHSLDHIALDEAYGDQPDSLDVPWDYLHLNSIEADDNGDLILSARHTHAIYKVERTSGRVLWRLNGKLSDFEMGPNTPFKFQHDARVHANGELTLFDNAESNQDLGGEVQSRGMILMLDEDAKTATLVGEYTHPTEILSVSQGNMQVLPNGNLFIGWGSAPVFSEHDADGNLIFNGRFPQGANSYRAYRYPWVGTPGALPDVAIESGLGDDLTVFASWNGATEVVTWEVLAGAGPDEMTVIGSTARTGFETSIGVQTAEPQLSVQALDAEGNVLGTSDPIMLGE